MWVRTPQSESCSSHPHWDRDILPIIHSQAAGLMHNCVGLGYDPCFLPVLGFWVSKYFIEKCHLSWVDWIAMVCAPELARYLKSEIQLSCLRNVMGSFRHYMLAT